MLECWILMNTNENWNTRENHEWKSHMNLNSNVWCFTPSGPSREHFNYLFITVPNWCTTQLGVNWVHGIWWNIRMKDWKFGKFNDDTMKRISGIHKWIYLMSWCRECKMMMTMMMMNTVKVWISNIIFSAYSLAQRNNHYSMWLQLTIQLK